MGLDIPYGTYQHMWKLALCINHLPWINENIIQLLSHFILVKHLSIYQIFKAEKLMNEKLSYKSTHKTVKRLLELDLIERVTDNSSLSEIELIRGAKYYKLSEEGLFTLHIKYKTNFPRFTIIKVNGRKRSRLVTLSKNSLLRYREYEFYKYCLYPWINYNTIANCSQQFAKTINDMLSDICIYIEKNLLSFFKNYLFSQLSVELDNVEKGIVDGTDKSPMASLLKKIYHSEDGDDNNTLLKEHGGKVSLSTLNFKERDILGQELNEISKQIASFSFKPIYYRVIFSLVIGNIKEEDKKLLGQDLKFKKVLVELNKQFHNNYNLLLK